MGELEPLSRALLRADRPRDRRRRSLLVGGARQRQVGGRRADRSRDGTSWAGAERRAGRARPARGRDPGHQLTRFSREWADHDPASLHFVYSLPEWAPSRSASREAEGPARKPRQPASRQGARPGRMSSETKGVGRCQLQPFTAASARRSTPWRRSGLPAPPRPARPGLRLGRRRTHVHTRGDLRRAEVDLALRAAAPGRSARGAAPRAWTDAARPGPTPGRRARCGRACLKSTRPIRRTRSRTGSSRSRPPRRRSSGSATSACSSTGNLANAVAARAAAEGPEAGVVLPGRPRAREAARDRGLRRDDGTAVRGSYDHCSRLTVELSFELDWAFVNVTPAPTTRRARRRSPTRSPSNSAGRRRTR